MNEFSERETKDSYKDRKMYFSSKDMCLIYLNVSINILQYLHYFFKLLSMFEGFGLSFKSMFRLFNSMGSLFTVVR